MNTINESVKVSHKNGICLLTLNKPEVRNALVTEMRIELTSHIKRLQNDAETKVMIITGEGSVFSAGGDLKSLQDVRTVDGRRRVKAGHELILSMLGLEKPIIAAVNGPAIGAGFSLALACDIIVSSDTATFTQSFSKVGVIPDLGSTFFLSQLVGPYLAKKLMFLGETISAQKAYELQIVSELASSELVLDEAYSLGRKLASGPSIANGLTKLLVNRSVYPNLQEVLELEAFSQGICFGTEDFQEGVQSFFEKRSPVFTGK